MSALPDPDGGLNEPERIEPPPSPVPVGQLNLKVFDQSVWWVDRNARPHRLTEMGADYRRNLIAFLTRHAGQLQHACMREEIRALFEDVMAGRVSGEVLALELGVPGVGDLTALAWLESTPLMRALRRLDLPA